MVGTFGVSRRRRQKTNGGSLAFFSLPPSLVSECVCVAALSVVCERADGRGSFFFSFYAKRINCLVS